MPIDPQTLIGREVRAANGAYLGKVLHCTATNLVVERGFFFPRDFDIPLTEISSSSVDTVHLRGTASEYHERFQAAPVPPQGEMTSPFTAEELAAQDPPDHLHETTYPGIGLPVDPGDEERLHAQPPPPRLPVDRPEEGPEPEEPALGDYPPLDDSSRHA